MRTRLVAALVAASSIPVSLCHAQEEEEVPATEPPSWAVAVGVQPLSVPIAGVGAGGIGGLAPTWMATLERRLDDRLWATLRASGYYQRDEYDGLAGFAWMLGGAAGIRHALTAPEPIEVSWYAELEASYARSSYEPYYGESSAGTLRLGLALDKQLVDWFGLRLQTALAQAGYMSSANTDYVTYTEAGSWWAGIGLSPSFAVKFTF